MISIRAFVAREVVIGDVDEIKLFHVCEPTPT